MRFFPVLNKFKEKNVSKLDKKKLNSIYLPNKRYKCILDFF